jgi:hypothetical protein
VAQGSWVEGPAVVQQAMVEAGPALSRRDPLNTF